jgi:hypothetical protein
MPRKAAVDFGPRGRAFSTEAARGPYAREQMCCDILPFCLTEELLVIFVTPLGGRLNYLEAGGARDAQRLRTNYLLKTSVRGRQDTALKYSVSCLALGVALSQLTK